MESRVPAFGRRMKNASNVKQGERERQILISRVYRVALVKPEKNGITAIEALRKLTSFTERKRS